MYDGIIIINKTRRPCKPEKPDRIEPHTSVRFFLGSQASRSIDSVSRSYGPQSGEERNRKGRERVWQWRKRASPTPSCSSFSPRSSNRSPTLSLSLFLALLLVVVSRLIRDLIDICAKRCFCCRFGCYRYFCSWRI